MTIQILPDGGYLPLSMDVPVVGRIYSLVDAAHGTIDQNKAFHALAQEYWRTGLHSYPARDFLEFRNCLKRALGAGFESYIYAELIDGKPVIRDAKRYEDIPESVRNDPGKRDLIRGRLKSYSDYTKKERSEFIERLIAEMIQAGVSTKKFSEIMDGMRKGF